MIGPNRGRGEAREEPTRLLQNMTVFCRILDFPRPVIRESALKREISQTPGLSGVFGRGRGMPSLAVRGREVAGIARGTTAPFRDAHAYPE